MGNTTRDKVNRMMIVAATLGALSSNITFVMIAEQGRALRIEHLYPRSSRPLTLGDKIGDLAKIGIEIQTPDGTNDKKQ